MSKVSIVAPIYNPGKKLKKCIESIINQTFSDFELILVNDGSTDGSEMVCNEYALKDNRIKVINKDNEGSVKTRRKGVEEAKSSYIMFVDADDWVDKKIVQRLYEEIIYNDCDIVVCNSYKVLGDKAIIKVKNNSKYFQENKIYENDSVRDELAGAYLHGDPFPASLCGKLYKKEFVINNGKYLNRIVFLGEDLYYNLEILIKSKRVKIISDTLYYYRAGGLTTKYMPYHFSDIVNGYKIQKEVIEEYYQESRQKRYNGISIMLINSFKTSLSNIMRSGYSKEEIYEKIQEYIKDVNIIEASKNEGAISYFEKDFLDSLYSKNIDYLYNLGIKINDKSRYKKKVINLICKYNI